MDYAIVAVPAAPVRRKPDHRKEMVNQLLFGELVKVIKTKGELWVKIQSLHDGYGGWMTNTMLLPIDESLAITTNAYVTSDMVQSVYFGEKHLLIPVGSSLPGYEKLLDEKQIGKGRLGSIEYHYSGNYFNRAEQQPSPELISQLATAWLNAPYLWGGRTPLGVDCSGFVQVVFKLMGIDLPRDAKQQAKVGVSVKNFEEIKAGDLAFFYRKKEIIHVGIILNDEQIIHSSGKVRIDKLTKKGMINSDTEKQTLKLKTVKRIF